MLYSDVRLQRSSFVFRFNYSTLFLGIYLIVLDHVEELINQLQVE
jgi:hypothetical protein